MKTEVTSSNPTPSGSTKKTSRSSRKKLKAPDSDAGDRGDAVAIAEDQFEDAFYRNDLAALMKEDPVMNIVRPKLIGGALLGPMTSPPTMNNKLDAAKTMLHLLKEAGYAPRAFAAHELFDLELKTIEGSSQNLIDKLAPQMEQHTTETRSATTAHKEPEMQDGNMESIGLHHAPLYEFDPDDLSIDSLRRAAVASAETSTKAGVAAPRIRVSAISELKEFSGKDNDENRARSWLSKKKKGEIRLHP
ncbi:unnamed protein product [Phytophthora fragariaefolia]|uniref:Unnamed protein product n=1 Tax=Phytophthora fragariaefolia TaxID=1490495 RepID=A0A9W6UC53_9STRA|nr:unnamed protein product [Phytophthora fragariaefolia]